MCISHRKKIEPNTCAKLKFKLIKVDFFVCPFNLLSWILAEADLSRLGIFQVRHSHQTPWTSCSQSCVQEGVWSPSRVMLLHCKFLPSFAFATLFLSLLSFLLLPTKMHVNRTTTTFDRLYQFYISQYRTQCITLRIEFSSDTPSCIIFNASFMKCKSEQPSVGYRLKITRNGKMDETMTNELS